MAEVAIDGSERDLERFGRSILKHSFSLEDVGPFERRMAWSMGSSAGAVSTCWLRSGITLSAASFRWEQPPTIAIDHAPGPLEFILSRGPAMHIESSEGERYCQGGGRFHVGQVKRPLRLICGWGEGPDSQQEHLCISIHRERLREFLGALDLPPTLQRIEQQEGAYPREAQSMTPAMFRLLDELLQCDARGQSRQLYFEARGLELVAALLDQIEENERAGSPLLSAHDVERLERARQLLLARMEDPPGLPELARRAGLNEAKLKAGFRALFGESVFGYLRGQRMDEAHRLLRQRRYSVTEVARRVGYENPSKFAAAFRKQFGVSPSSVG